MASSHSNNSFFLIRQEEMFVIQLSVSFCQFLFVTWMPRHIDDGELVQQIINFWSIVFCFTLEKRTIHQARQPICDAMVTKSFLLLKDCIYLFTCYKQKESTFFFLNLVFWVTSSGDKWVKSLSLWRSIAQY
jgi:hypothetical protein